MSNLFTSAYMSINFDHDLFVLNFNEFFFSLAFVRAFV